MASLLGGLVDSGPLLIASRFIKGLSAAFTAPAGLSIITTTFPEGPLRNRALSIYSSCAATGFSMGLVLSGLLTEAGWRWTMLLPAPVALIALAAGLKLMPRSEPGEGPGRGYDMPGAVTGTGVHAAAGLHRGLRPPARLGVGPHPAAPSPPSPCCWPPSSRSSAARRTRWSGSAVLRSSSQVRAKLGAMAFFGSYVAFQFLVTQYMQNVLGWSAPCRPRSRSCRPARWWRSSRPGSGRSWTGSARLG